MIKRKSVDVELPGGLAIVLVWRLNQPSIGTYEQDWHEGIAAWVVDNRACQDVTHWAHIQSPQELKINV